MIAGPPPVEVMPETAYCVISASHRFALPPEAVLSVLLQEAGTVGLKKQNSSDLSFDYGPMQVNSVWLDPKSPLHRFSTADLLANNLCHNIHAGAWIIAKHYAKKKDIWQAIGMYHAPKYKSIAYAYMHRVNKKLPKARHLLSSNQHYVHYLDVFYKKSYGKQFEYPVN